VTKKLSAAEIRDLGFEWPKYEIVETHSEWERGKVDLDRALQRMRSSRSFYRKQIADGYAFKTKANADYADFTDRFDDYVWMESMLGEAICYLESIVKAAGE
jgi:hypothetical protein